MENCIRPSTPDVGIAACSRLIASGRVRGPKQEHIYGLRARAYTEKRDFDHAIADFTSAINLDPGNAELHYVRGFVYSSEMHDYSRGVADFTEALRLNPKYAAALSARGSAYARMGEFDRALADINEAIRLDPNNPRKWVHFENRCRAYLLAGNLAQALSDCDEAVRISEGRIAHPLSSRGLARLKRGELDMAITDFSAAIKLYSKFADALYLRGIALLKKGNASAGRADIAAAKALESDVAESYTKYGIAEAATTTSAPVPAQPPAADCARAETHWKTAEDMRTLAVYEDHLRRFPTCEFADLARARIEMLRK
jgi:tetratricopeptide (TPR) repeat protein